MGERKIIKLPARFQFSSTGGKTLRKVAVYARVSTHREEQENSLEAQKDYFTKYVNNHPGWVMYKLFVDEGVSGTRKERRKGFSSMMEDAIEGKFDLIVTKSVSRFARNTVDTLISIRKLKEIGVEIYFEKENIFTFDSKGEFLITLLGSLAQEESRSISENIKWGVRAAFAKGKYVIHVKTFLGYEKNYQGEYVICEEEAMVVRLIFFLAFMGETPYTIAQLFNDLEIPKIMPRTKIWSPATIVSILRNEKYKGDALLQKKFITDYLTKKAQKNTGELPQYYVTDGHPAIIPRATFDFMQQRLDDRKQYGYSYSSRHGGYCLVVCEKCNLPYGRRIAHSNDKYRKIFWRCNGFYRNGCHMPTMEDSEFKNLFYNTVQEWIYLQANRLERILIDIKDLFGKEISTAVEEIVDTQGQLIFDRSTCKVLVVKITVTHNQDLIFDFIDGTKLRKHNSAARPRT